VNSAAINMDVQVPLVNSHFMQEINSKWIRLIIKCKALKLLGKKCWKKYTGISKEFLDFTPIKQNP
jgi:hypothetical protein